MDLKTEGCVIDYFSSKRAKLNNTFLAQYLTNKYGKTWKKDLLSKPFGLDNI
ncbi:FEKKY domain-containing protein [Halpernia sp. GG3]